MFESLLFFRIKKYEDLWCSLLASAWYQCVCMCWLLDWPTVVTVTSVVTYSRPGGAPASQGPQRERGGVDQQCERRHACGEDLGSRACCGTQDGDLHWNQCTNALKFSKCHLFLFLVWKPQVYCTSQEPPVHLNRPLRYIEEPFCVLELWSSGSILVLMQETLSAPI